MQNTISIVNKKNAVEINIEGTIGIPESWQFEDPGDRVSTYDKFRNAIDLIKQIDAPEIIVNIRSTGGDVNDALLILDAVSSLKGKKRTRCHGYTASAATIIAQAASEGCREISANALYLIHTSACTTEGNAEHIEAQITLLRKTDERIASIYATRSGRGVEEFTTLMAENNGNGRWLSPKEAVDAGLADVVINTPEVLNCTVIDEKPIKKNMVKIKNIYNGILRWLGATPGEGLEVEVTEEQIGVLNQRIETNEQHERDLDAQLVSERAAHEQTRAERTTAQNRVTELEAELKRASVKPTTTTHIEDPEINGGKPRVGNQKSYEEDVKNFK